MKYLRLHWFISLLTIALIFVISIELFIKHSGRLNQIFKRDEKKSLIPDVKDLSDSPNDDLIRYGKELIDNTSKYLGPYGAVAQISNGLNCQNCHLESGTKLFTNNFLSVASTYPKFRERSGKYESVEYRINECLQRSLDGSQIDSLSKEMRAMVSYIKWTGKNVTKNLKAEGLKTKELTFLPIAAQPSRGILVFEAKCKSCHGANGEGIILKDSLQFLYPPLWGKNSYAVSAGIYRITKLASFIKFNMPFGANYQKPQLSDKDAWDVAAYICSQPHPNKMFAYDWPMLATKPVDYPFGPYSDAFSEQQHKYGPFGIIQNARKK